MWTPELLRADTPALARTIYLNTGTLGASPKSVTVAFVKAYQSWQAAGPGYPERYLAERAAVEPVRARLGLFLHARPEDLALAENITTALNWIALSLPFRDGDEVIVGVDEHPGNRYPWRALEAMHRVTVRPWPLAEDDETLLTDLGRRITARTRLVSVSHVLQTNGRILPVERIVALCHEAGVPVLIDGAQAVGQIPVDLEAIGADAYAFDGHKWLLGPVGTAGLHVRPAFFQTLGLLPAGSGSAAHDLAGRLEPDVPFLERPARWEVGTRNWPLYQGLAAAIGILEEIGVATMAAISSELARAFVAALPPGVAVEDVPRRAGMVSVTVPKRDPRAFASRLYALGRVVVRAVEERPAATLRFSFAGYNTPADVAAALATLEAALKEA
jgi:selenocysteine lyase/cysteine desulfurase